jgi:hypothetical protein
MAIWMGFVGFYRDPNVGGQFTQGPINHLLPATWALVERFINAMGEISKHQETCGAIFFGWVWDIAQVAIIGRKI